MKYIVDTSVWSEALRRKQHKETDTVLKLRTLLNEGERVFLLGIVLQEVLQGVRHSDQFKQIKERLEFLPILPINREDHVYAAELYNLCRSKGVSASSIDFLIASVTIRNECLILTADRDFEHISRHTELRLL